MVGPSCRDHNFREGMGPQLADTCRAAARNVDGNYHRSLRHWAAPKAAPGDPAKLPDGAAVEETGGSIGAPCVPQWPVFRHPHLCFPNQSPAQQSSTDEPSITPNTQTPKRSGERLGAPSPQRLRPYEVDRELAEPHCKSFRNFFALRENALTVDYSSASRNPTGSRPPYQDLYWMEDPDSL